MVGRRFPRSSFLNALTWQLDPLTSSPGDVAEPNFHIIRDSTEPKRTKDGRWWVPGPNWKPTVGEPHSHQVSPGDSTSVEPGLFLPLLEGWPVH